MNGACNSTFYFGPTPCSPGEGSKGQISLNFNFESVGICDGMPSTLRSSLSLLIQDKEYIVHSWLELLPMFCGI